MDDIDPQETREWLDAMEALIQHGGRERAALRQQQRDCHDQDTHAARR